MLVDRLVDDGLMLVNCVVFCWIVLGIIVLVLLVLFWYWCWDVLDVLVC